MAMKLLSTPIKDERIDAYDIMCEMTLQEYYNLVKDSMRRNDLQRGRVASSKSIYALLKDDIIAGCIIPPIVLSIFSEFTYTKDAEEIIKYIKANQNELIILDGLQRTFTIQDIINEYQDKDDKSVLQRTIRLEFYLGLNREGVLYRMLTLNTGQTRMSLRHQIEMIYRDLLYEEDTKDIHLLNDTDKGRKGVKTFYFSEAVDAYTSFLSGDYLQITREKILDTIESFNELANLKQNKNAFMKLLTVYSKFIKVASNILDSRSIDIHEFADDKGITLFGSDGVTIFNKSQALTGYAAAVNRLLALKVYDEISDIEQGFDSINDENFFQGTLDLLSYLSEIRDNSKKIGNSQRCLFYYVFKNMLDKENCDCYMKFAMAVKKAKQNYERDY